MIENNQKPNILFKFLGSAVLAGIIAIVAFIWSIYSTRSDNLAMNQQVDNQATQIANQELQIALNTEQNQLLSLQVTLNAQQDFIEDQLLTPISTENTDFALTATSFAAQSNQIETTRQAIDVQQEQIQATQTVLAQPLSNQTSTLFTQCPLIVIEGSVGGLAISQTKTWAELEQQGTTDEPKSDNINQICSRDRDDKVQVWIGYWANDVGYLDYRGAMDSNEALALSNQYPQQPILIVPWGD